jgi:hypothetical protein
MLPGHNDRGDYRISHDRSKSGWYAKPCRFRIAVITSLTTGATIVEGGRPPIILSAGYFGSSVFGGAFILGGFDTLVAKILSFVLGLGLITPLVLVRDKL